MVLEKREEYFVYLSSKTTLDKSGPVVAHHDFMFNLFCLAGHELRRIRCVRVVLVAKKGHLGMCLPTPQHFEPNSSSPYVCVCMFERFYVPKWLYL